MIIGDINRVFSVGMISVGNSRGSCFMVKHHDELYVVTAYHVLYKPDGNLINSDGALFFSNQESYGNNYLNVNICFEHIQMRSNCDEDLALFKYDPKNEYIAEARNNNIILSPISISSISESELWTSKVFILGYPTSLHIEAPYDFKPMVASGVVSAYDRASASFIVNAPVYYGNSGCPVLRIGEGGTIEIVGVVQKLVMFNLEWKNPYERDLLRLDWHNSGYTYCLHASRILQLLG